MLPARLLCLLCFAAGISVGAEPLVADDPAIEEVRLKMSGFVKERRWSEAVKTGERLRELRRAKLGEEHPDTALADIALGDARMELREWAQAEAHFVRALAVQEKALPEGDPELRTSLTRLAAALKEQRRYGEAEPLLRRALELQLQHAESKHDDTAAYARNLGWILRLQARYDEALPWFEQALAIRRELRGLSAASTRASLRELGELHELRGDLGAAEKCALERIAGVEEAVGLDAAQFAEALADLGALEERQARLPPAKRRFELAAKILADAPPSVESIAGWRSLARAHEVARRWPEMRAALEKELAFRTELFGPDDPGTIEAVSRFGRLSLETGDHPAAAQSFGRLVGWFQKHAPGDQTGLSEALRQHAIATFRAGGAKEAALLFERSKSWHETTFGREHLATLSSGYDLWTFQANSGRLPAALKTAREVIARSERLLGKEAPQTLAALDRLAQLHSQLEQRAEASAVYRRVLAGTRKHFGADSAEYFAALRKLADWLEEHGDFAAATPLRAERASLAMRKFGASHEETAAAQGDVAVNAARTENMRAASVAYANQLQALAALPPDPRHQAQADETAARIVQALIARRSKAADRRVLEGLRELARVSFQHDARGAVLFLTEAVAISSERPGEAKQETAMFLRMLALAHERQGRLAEARDALERSLEAEQTGRFNSGAEVVSHCFLASLALRQGDRAAAEEALEKAAGLLQARGGSADPFAGAARAALDFLRAL
jgi:hypothetical protein